MLRVRFKANEEDYRPVNWPVKHPYWCSGSGGGCSIVISYADDESYIYENWPEAKDLVTEEVDGYTFTDRFPKPDWFSEGQKERTMPLKTYIITKVVQAEPQDCPEGTYNSKAGDPGYKIVSEDGHVSWRSKETFERAYKELEGLTFGLAIEALRKGLKVRLPHWEEGVYLIMYSFMKNEDSKDPYEVITIVGHAGRAQWMPDTQDDILSEKWQIID